jgi:hypothetical protein
VHALLGELLVEPFEHLRGRDLDVVASHFSTTQGASFSRTSDASC